MSEDPDESGVTDPKYFDDIAWVKLRDAVTKVIDIGIQVKAAVRLRRADLVDYSLVERVAKDKKRAVDDLLDMIADIAAETKNVNL